ncbi:hypothetical protein K458DRAFT_397227 [Lentithecium fluviatile CBS 122367]|uniref:Uncharacterized protein n=1 Tax=Lentithecium fluviatile CBS 122367 TaxID=1168545 RepID=A0A6G1IE80_9PLEO|nr:hypothetical protein K458DRAFT_397227 [Lentithecium fluviatile CBS 122367]
MKETTLSLTLMILLLLQRIASGHLISRADCNASADWQTNPDAYLRADTDASLRNWWAGISSAEHSGFSNELGKAFGTHVPYECGLTDDSACIYAGCRDFEEIGDPIWAYMSQISMVNLHILFKVIDEGITKGQLDFSNRLDKLVLTFFPWKEPNFVAEDILIWMTFLVSVAATVVPFLAPARIAAMADRATLEAVSGGISALATSGMSQISNEIKPDSKMGFETLATFKEFAADYGESARAALDNWSNSTFLGEYSANRSILDYFEGGAMVDHTFLPSASEVEAFYKKQLFSTVINAQWKKRKVFTTFFRTNDRNDSSGPNQTRYYLDEDGGVYYTYAYHEDGILRGYLGKPTGLDQMNETAWGISGTDITKASAGAFRIGRFNYTEEMAVLQLNDAIASNGTLSPWEDGAGWRGTWTIPVCDMGSNNWNTQFDNKTSRYGMLPCCCGTDCKDTTDFVRAANLYDFQTLLYGCEEQLKGTMIDFNKIDYGFKKKKNFAFYWATSSKAKRAGLVIAFILSFVSFGIGIGVCLGL